MKNVYTTHTRFTKYKLFLDDVVSLRRAFGLVWFGGLEGWFGGYILLSCHSTLPVGEFAQCLMRLRCFFPSLLSRLWPSATSQSCICLPCRHLPRIIFLCASSLSKTLFWNAGNRSLIRLCSTMQAVTIILMVFGLCCIVVNSTWNRFARMPKAFSTTLLPLDSL